MSQSKFQHEADRWWMTAREDEEAIEKADFFLEQTHKLFKAG